MILPEWMENLTKEIEAGLLDDDRAKLRSDIAGLMLDGINLDMVQWRIAILRNDRMLALLADNEAPYALKCKSAILGVTAYCRATIDGAPRGARGNKVLLERATRLAKQVAWAASARVQPATWEAKEKEVRAIKKAVRAAEATGRDAYQAAQAAKIAVRKSIRAAEAAVRSADAAGQAASSAGILVFSTAASTKWSARAAYAAAGAAKYAAFKMVAGTKETRAAWLEEADALLHCLSLAISTSHEPPLLIPDNKC
jgi:hypothetical protein